MSFSLPRSWARPGAAAVIRADFVTPDGLEFTEELIGIEPPCERLSFNFALGEGQLTAGQIIDDEYSQVGITIRAESNGGDDAVILFDSEHPTSNDDDLQTPGTGAGNDTPLGMVLVIADDLIDNDGDGLVDDPGDEELGGTIIIEFEEPATLCGLGLLDLDKGGVGSVVTLFDASGAQIDEVDLPSLGDNSFQELVALVENVSRIEVQLISSGAIPFIDLVPCPTVFRFDRNTFGVPNNFQPGEEITGDELQGQVQLTATNNLPGHPDMVVFFDSANPTGEDNDLQTPGPGAGNDTPHRGILIIPEDAVDVDGDGLIDDPDDEAAGGTMRFEFVTEREFRFATVLDVDGAENSFVVLYDQAGQQVGMLPLANLGDNSIQTVSGDAVFKSLELVLGGSGALVELATCPLAEAPNP